MPNWLLLILTSLASGLVGSIITTYGPGARERRRARADAREAIRKADRLAADPPNVSLPSFTAALDDLETAAMIARLSRALTELHREACELYWTLAIEKWRLAAKQRPPGSLLSEIGYKGPRELECWQVAHQAADLLAFATWHPYVSIPYRMYRTRHLIRVLRSIRTTQSFTAKPPVKGQSEADNAHPGVQCSVKTISSLSGMLADRLHLHKSRPERVPGCPRVTVKVRGRPPDRARGGHTLVMVQLGVRRGCASLMCAPCLRRSDGPRVTGRISRFTWSSPPACPRAGRSFGPSGLPGRR
jgi:hypothetical protein